MALNEINKLVQCFSLLCDPNNIVYIQLRGDKNEAKNVFSYVFNDVIGLNISKIYHG